MDTRRLIEELTRPEAYPHTTQDVQVRQTHISVVFLAGAFAYKVKKPLDLGFLDFTSPAKRLHFCREEVRLNRRLAPEVYLGVVPITEGEEGLRVEGSGETVEHAVKMRRLPPDATLRARLLRDELTPEVLRTLAGRIARFHDEAESGPRIAEQARWEVVAENARENLRRAQDQVGLTLSRAVLDRLEGALEVHLEGLRPLIERRAERGVPRDTHGDLHLDHVYLFPEQPVPRDLVIIDCIEFSERFRHADPVSDAAFLAMDLIHLGRRDLERTFSAAYFQASEDEEGRSLLPFYRSYRAAVRGKVEGLAATEEEIPTDEREEATRSARGHWGLALTELEPASRRPGLVLVSGLPGSGKSTIAEGLAHTCGFGVISSDRMRKRLAGIPEDTPAPASFGEGIYGPDWTERTYARCLEEARKALFEGERVLIDATFREEEARRAFLATAREHGVRALLVRCEANPEVIRGRMEGRGGPSDADWQIHREVAARWEPLSTETERAATKVRTDTTREEATADAVAQLRLAGLAE